MSGIKQSYKAFKGKTLQSIFFQLKNIYFFTCKMHWTQWLRFFFLYTASTRTHAKSKQYLTDTKAHVPASSLCRHGLSRSLGIAWDLVLSELQARGTTSLQTRCGSYWGMCACACARLPGTDTTVPVCLEAGFENEKLHAEVKRNHNHSRWVLYKET